MPQLPRTDTTLAEEGIWVVFSPGVEFRIARARNTRYAAEVIRLMGDGMRAMKHRRGNLSDREQDHHVRAAAKFILVDWRGIPDDDGETPWAYSIEHAYELLSDPKWSEIQEFVWGIAEDAAIYRLSEVEAAEGN